MKEEACSRNVKSSCSQPSLCALHLHLTSGPDVPVSHKASYKSVVLPCPRTFCVSRFGNTEPRGKSCLLIQGKANTAGLHVFHLCPLSWTLLLGFGPQQTGGTHWDVAFSVGVSFTQLCAAVLRLGKERGRLGKYLSPEFNEIIIAL